MLHRYESVHMLLEEAQILFDSFDIEDITEDSHSAVIVDTILSSYSHTSRDVINAIESFGGAYEDCCTECIYMGKLREDCEFLHEVLEDKANDEADEINNIVKSDNGFFYFDWQDGAFCLFFGRDVG